jgi:hypothetical protein
MILEIEFEHRIGMVTMKGETLWKYAPRAARMAGMPDGEGIGKFCIIPCWVIGKGENKTLLALGSKRPSPGIGDDAEDIDRTGYFPNDEITLAVNDGGVA